MVRKTGERFQTLQGYVLVKQDKGYPISEHKLVMEDHLGRKLMKGENIHHKNSIRDDNRIENLELWTLSQPAGSRVEDKIAWAIEFLSDYGYEVHGGTQVKLFE